MGGGTADGSPSTVDFYPSPDDEDSCPCAVQLKAPEVPGRPFTGSLESTSCFITPSSSTSSGSSADVFVLREGNEQSMPELAQSASEIAQDDVNNGEDEADVPAERRGRVTAMEGCVGSASYCLQTGNVAGLDSSAEARGDRGLGEVDLGLGEVHVNHAISLATMNLPPSEEEEGLDLVKKMEACDKTGSPAPTTVEAAMELPGACSQSETIIVGAEGGLEGFNAANEEALAISGVSEATSQELPSASKEAGAACGIVGVSVQVAQAANEEVPAGSGSLQVAIPQAAVTAFGNLTVIVTEDASHVSGLLASDSTKGDVSILMLEGLEVAGPTEAVVEEEQVGGKQTKVGAEDCPLPTCQVSLGRLAYETGTNESMPPGDTVTESTPALMHELAGMQEDEYCRPGTPPALELGKTDRPIGKKLVDGKRSGMEEEDKKDSFQFDDEDADFLDDVDFSEGDKLAEVTILDKLILFAAHSKIVLCRKFAKKSSGVGEQSPLLDRASPAVIGRDEAGGSNGSSTAPDRGFDHPGHHLPWSWPWRNSASPSAPPGGALSNPPNLHMEPLSGSSSPQNSTDSPVNENDRIGLGREQLQEGESGMDDNRGERDEELERMSGRGWAKLPLWIGKQRDGLSRRRPWKKTNGGVDETGQDKEEARDTDEGQGSGSGSEDPRQDGAGTRTENEDEAGKVELMSPGNSQEVSSGEGVILPDRRQSGALQVGGGVTAVGCGLNESGDAAVTQKAADEGANKDSRCATARRRVIGRGAELKTRASGNTVTAGRLNGQMKCVRSGQVAAAGWRDEPDLDDLDNVLMEPAPQEYGHMIGRETLIPIHCDCGAQHVLRSGGAEAHGYSLYALKDDPISHASKEGILLSDLHSLHPLLPDAISYSTSHLLVQAGPDALPSSKETPSLDSSALPLPLASSIPQPAPTPSPSLPSFSLDFLNPARVSRKVRDLWGKDKLPLGACQLVPAEFQERWFRSAADGDEAGRWMIPLVVLSTLVGATAGSVVMGPLAMPLALTCAGMEAVTVAGGALGALAGARLATSVATTLNLPCTQPPGGLRRGQQDESDLTLTAGFLSEDDDEDDDNDYDFIKLKTEDWDWAEASSVPGSHRSLDPPVPLSSLPETSPAASLQTK